MIGLVTALFNIHPFVWGIAWRVVAVLLIGSIVLFPEAYFEAFVASRQALIDRVVDGIEATTQP